MATEFDSGLDFPPPDFPPVDHATWRKAVEGDLRGVAFEKRMVSTGYDGIEVQPLFTEADFPTRGDPAGLPGFAPFARAASPLGNTPQGWDIQQQPDHPEPARGECANSRRPRRRRHFGRFAAGCGRPSRAGCRDAAEALRGRDGVMVSTRADLARVLEGVRLDIAGVWLQAGAGFLPAAALHVAAAEAGRHAGRYG